MEIYKQGASDKARETAERMIRKGQLSDADIADYTGLSVEQVEKIKEKVLATA